MFVDLQKEFVARGGTDVKSAYPLRVVLRFLRWLNPPAIKGTRSGYRLAEGLPPEAPEELQRRAFEAVDALPRKG